MRIYLLLFCSICFIFSGFSQQGWMNGLNNQRDFIANKGQYAKISTQTIEFACKVDGLDLFFLKNSAFYRFTTHEQMAEDEIEKMESKLEKNGDRKAKKSEEEKEKEARFFKKAVHTDFELVWKNSNPNVQISGLEKQSHYYTFQQLTNEKMDAYKRLKYTELYPGIDLIYEFPEKSKGIKYSFILHSGADLSQVKIEYKQAQKLSIDSQGNLIVFSVFGDFVEHSPISFFENGKEIEIEYKLNGNELSFEYKKKKKNTELFNEILTVDPWVEVPNIPFDKKLYEIGKDSLNNVYVFGATSNATVQKYGETGSLIWTLNLGYDGSGYFGDMAVSNAGLVYVSWFQNVLKIDQDGGIIWQDSLSFIMDENWRCSFNCDYSKLLIALCSGTSNVVTIDVASNTVSSTFETFPANGEIRALTRGLSGKFYGLTIGVEPEIIAIDYDFSPIYSVPSRQDFRYSENTYNVWGGKNAIAANNDFIFTYDGVKLSKRMINSGFVLDSVFLSNGIIEFNSGVDVDDCGNVYCGAQNRIYKLNSNLQLMDSITTPNAVYDLTLGNNGNIFACGDGFVGLFGLETCPISSCSCLSSVSTNADCHGANNGTASIITNGGVGPFDYLWDNGDTTAVTSGLSLGEHGFTVTSSGGCVVSGVVLISSISVSINDRTNCTFDSITCLSLANGSATANPTVGSEPYSYVWNTVPPQFTQIATGLTTGTYTVVVSDSFACQDSVSVEIQSQGIPKVIVYIDTFSCQPYLAVMVEGGSDFESYQYHWSTGDTVSSIYITENGTYDYEVVDTSGGCLADASGSITINSIDSLVWQIDSMVVSGSCGNEQLQFFISTGETLYFDFIDSNFNYYSFNTNTISDLPSGTYSVQAYDFFFCKDTIFEITLVNGTAISIQGDSIICFGEQSVLTVSGAESYQWFSSNSLNTSTGAVVEASPQQTETFFVVGTTQTCIDTASYTVQVNPPPFAQASVSNTISCLHETATVSAFSMGNTITWSGQGIVNAPNPLVVSSVGTYTASVLNPITGCSANYSINVVQGTDPVASFTANPSSGDAPLQVTFTNTSQNANAFAWDFGNSSTANTLNAVVNYPDSGIYVVQLIAFNDTGCPDTAYASIFVFKNKKLCEQIQLIVPNIFTVNEDQINEEFIIAYAASTEFTFSFQIYNRWGQLVREITDIHKNWDGKTQNGKVCEPGTYFYKIKLKCESGEKLVDGFIQLVR